jgi:hypothetical protein
MTDPDEPVKFRRIDACVFMAKWLRDSTRPVPRCRHDEVGNIVHARNRCQSEQDRLIHWFQDAVGLMRFDDFVLLTQNMSLASIEAWPIGDLRTALANVCDLLEISLLQYPSVLDQPLLKPLAFRAALEMDESKGEKYPKCWYKEAYQQLGGGLKYGDVDWMDTAKRCLGQSVDGVWTNSYACFKSIGSEMLEMLDEDGDNREAENCFEPLAEEVTVANRLKSATGWSQVVLQIMTQRNAPAHAHHIISPLYRVILELAGWFMDERPRHVFQLFEERIPKKKSLTKFMETKWALSKVPSTTPMEIVVEQQRGVKRKLEQ